MRFLLSIIFIVSLSAENVLVINSNSNVKKYNDVVQGFKENFNGSFNTLDISKMKSNEIKEYLYNEYPDVVYVVGSKAYRYAYKYLPERKIFFTSIVNWKRLPSTKYQYGISNELHSGVQLTLIKAIFSDIKKIGIIYSKYTQDVYEKFTINASQMDIEIVSKKITNIQDVDFNQFLKNCEAYIILPDPVLLKSKSAIENLFIIAKNLKKPIFAYDELFIKYGAVLATSVDNSTIGRQAAITIQRLVLNTDVEKIQFPIGTSIVFNKKIAQEINLKFNEKALTMVNKIVE